MFTTQRTRCLLARDRMNANPFTSEMSVADQGLFRSTFSFDGDGGQQVSALPLPKNVVVLISDWTSLVRMLRATRFILIMVKQATVISLIQGTFAVIGTTFDT